MSKKDSSQRSRVIQRDKIKDTLEIREFEWTPNQLKIIETVLHKDTKILFLEGPAGTSKTFLAVYCGLKLLNEKKVSDIIYIRNTIESSSKSLGALPGDTVDKLRPFMLPLQDKLDEFLYKADVNKLINDSRVSGMVVNHLRGSSFNAKFIISDESQQLDSKEITTILTRIGKYSKLILCGDPTQSDINGRSSFAPMYNLFNDEESQKEGIFCIKLGIEDCLRSGVVKFILTKLEGQKKKSI